MRRVGIPRQRSTVKTTTLQTPLQSHYTLSTVESRQVRPTCAGDSSEHPALAVFDRPGASFAPLLEDRHAAVPSVRRNSIRVRLAPATGQQTFVTVRVHLKRKHVEEDTWLTL